MSHRMVSGHGATGFAVHGKEYSCDENLQIVVDDPHVNDAMQHGFRYASAEEIAAAGGIGEEFTPADVASMKREDMMKFLQRRGVDEEDIPDRTGDLRAAVMRVADEEADVRAGKAATMPVSKAKASKAKAGKPTGTAHHKNSERSDADADADAGAAEDGDGEKEGEGEAKATE